MPSFVLLMSTVHLFCPSLGLVSFSLGSWHLCCCCACAYRDGGGQGSVPLSLVLQGNCLHCSLSLMGRFSSLPHFLFTFPCHSFSPTLQPELKSLALPVGVLQSRLASLGHRSHFQLQSHCAWIITGYSFGDLIMVNVWVSYWQNSCAYASGFQSRPRKKN